MWQYQSISLFKNDWCIKVFIKFVTQNLENKLKNITLIAFIDYAWLSLPYYKMYGVQFLIPSIAVKQIDKFAR
jgi:hypothetical protein